MRLDYTQLADDLRRDGLSFISGKWFNQGQEVNINRHLRRCLAPLGVSASTGIDEVKDAFIDLYAGEDGNIWPPIPLLAKAEEYRKQSEVWERLPDMPEWCRTYTSQQWLLLSVCLFHPEEEVAFILCGKGGSGKSSFLNLVRQLYGEMDSFPMSLADLENGFLAAAGSGARLIFSEEMAADSVQGEAGSRLKKMASKQYDLANPKNQRPFRMKWQAAIILACNKPPRIDCDDSGLLRRLVYLPMDEKIINPNPAISRYTYSEHELVSIAAEALSRYKEDWRKAFQKDTYRLLTGNNSVFLAGGKTYLDYTLNCQAKGLKAFSEPRYTEIKALFEEWGIM